MIELINTVDVYDLDIMDIHRRSPSKFKRKKGTGNALVYVFI